MEVAQINDRVDAALAANRHAETIVVMMAIGIFVAGLSVLGVAYWQQNPYVAGGSVVLNGFLYWPIREILKLRRENIALLVLPVMLAQLPPGDAVRELKKLADHLRGKA